jgi:hypothetical protein
MWKPSCSILDPPACDADRTVPEYEVDQYFAIDYSDCEERILRLCSVRHLADYSCFARFRRPRGPMILTEPSRNGVPSGMNASGKTWTRRARRRSKQDVLRRDREGNWPGKLASGCTFDNDRGRAMLVARISQGDRSCPQMSALTSD